MRAGGLGTQIAWPAGRLAEGVEALALAAGLTLREGAGSSASATLPHDSQDQARLERLGDWLGLAIESVGFAGGEAADLVRGGAPAVLPLDAGHAMLVGVRRGRARLLAPGGSVRYVAVAKLATAVTASREDARDEGLERGLAAAGCTERECAAVHAVLGQARAGKRSHVAWLIRAPAEAPWRMVARSVRLGARLAGLLAAKSAEQIAWVLSWWVIGRGALEGRFDPGWLAAWVLLLACMVPLQAGTLRAAGRLAVDLGAEIRRRLMAGALRMQPDELRREGVGQSLGRVLESDALESLALGGGFLALFAAVEIVVAVLVLAAGASPLAQVAALLAWIALAGLLARRYLAARREWTDRRLALTHDLVEAMVGQSTRLIQEAPERSHDAEDRALAAYLPNARAMDRRMIALTAWIPRGWMLLGVLTAGPAFLAGASTAKLAISVGGVLFAYRALRQMVEGLADLAAAIVAWERVEPILRAAERTGAVADPVILSLEERARQSKSVPVLSARDVSFHHQGRREAVLAGCDLDVRRGEKLVLEGRSGCGKSTLAAILGGLRAPDTGLVLACGLDSRTLGARGWRGRVALAPQFHENHVFGGSLLFNLLMGRNWPPGPQDVEAAEHMCRRLGLGPLLERMPAGILQWVGETGWRLSHGERARVWIARALLQRAEVVVIDEGLDALDPVSLRQVQAVLREERAAVLVIAHT